MKKDSFFPAVKQNPIQKIVLTGGPGSGKTSLILALKNRGYHVVHEAATDWIMYQQACGNQHPWEEPDFQRQIFRLQKQQEKRIYPIADIVFLDRGGHDCLAYLEPETALYQEIENEAHSIFYDHVFLIAPLNFMETNLVRREDAQEAKNLHDKLKNVYKAFGYNPIILYPEKTLELRVEKLLETLKKLSSSNPYVYKMLYRLPHDQENHE